MLALSIAVATAVAVFPGIPAFADPGDEPPVDLGFRVAEFEPGDFVDEAAELPEELRVAVERDLGFSAAEYLAQAEAAIASLDSVRAIEDAGIEVVDFEMDGTELVVYVGDEASAEAVEGTGARAVIGEREEVDTSGIELEFKDDIRGGQPYIYEDVVPDDFYRCSIAFAGYDVSSGEQQAITAGHCLGDSASPRWTITATRPNVFPNVPAVLLGSVVPGSYALGNGYDHGLIDPVAGRNLVPEVLRWGNGANPPLSNPPLVVRDAVEPVAGSPICRSGSTTGWRCGTILEVDAWVDVEGDFVSGIWASVCLLSGDSGGAALVGTAAVGINSAGNVGATCASSNDRALFSQLYSSEYESADSLYNGDWEPMVGVAVPTVTNPGINGVYTGNTLNGTLPFGGTRHRVVVTIDGTITRTANVNSSGAWSINIADLPAGAHEFTLRARWGERSMSAAVTGGWIDTGAATRHSGPTRYETAVEISKAAFPGTAPIVFVASGTNYPDALSAGPAAVELGGPLLLTMPTSLPTAVRAELERLEPEQIIIAGGSGAVSNAVAAQLAQYASDPVQPVVRLGGADRYATSRLIADYAFDDATHAFIATGRNFPDALSAGAAGASMGAPVVLVDGGLTTADLATRNLLAGFGVDRILIAGGTGVVSTGIQSNLTSIAPVTRLSGPSRFDTALAINEYAFDEADSAYIAYSHNFPDALAGSVLAGVDGAPMYIATSACVSRGMVDHMIEIGVSSITLFGGASVLGTNVANLRRC